MQANEALVAQLEKMEKLMTQGRVETTPRRPSTASPPSSACLASASPSSSSRDATSKDKEKAMPRSASRAPSSSVATDAEDEDDPGSEASTVFIRLHTVS